MNGLRSFRSASLRLAVPMGIEDETPEETQRLREGIREIIDVQAGNQGKGHATGLMNSVCTEADVNAMVLMLQVQVFADGLGNDQLIKFYSKFRFETIQTEPVTLMARKPS